MNAKWQLSTAYHPQTNGLTERVNRTICSMLMHYCQEQNQTKWTRILPLINFAYNSSVNRINQVSPFFLLYGREPMLPVDLQTNPDVKKTTLGEYMKFMNHEWKFVKEQAQIHSATSQEKQAEYHDKKNKIRTYEVGQLVLREFNLREGKLGPKYEGPFQIIKKMGNTTYIVKRENSTDEFRVHASQIKLYH
ncbi:uncharacterized protein LOC128390549 [Panonychus citri]|uniref:uncharacterized protein LOC128390549 n=1 Tax=Panonychus citri TaxID=50023 RepID=UPI002306E406|nr:uncharacterized protein LOC128390549 [Panonychus citri]